MDRQKVAEVEDMFGPEGNWEDYWLGNPPSTNSFMSDDEGWVSAEEVVRGMRRREDQQVRSEDATYEAMLRNKGESGGGIVGLDPEYAVVYHNLLAAGERALAAERRQRM